MYNRYKKVFNLIVFGLITIFVIASCAGKNGTNGAPGPAGAQGPAGPQGPAAAGSIMPIIQSITVQGLPAEPTSNVTAMVVAQSPSGLALTYTWTTSSGWTIASGGNTPTATITAPSTYGAAGTATITVTDSQGRSAVGIAALNTMSAIQSSSSNPVINQLSFRTVPALPGANIIGSVTAFSPQGLTLTYNWTVSSGWTIISGGNTPVVTIQAPNTYGATGTATITVTDTYGGSTTWKYPLSTITSAPIIQSTNVTGSPANPNGSVIATAIAYSPIGLALTYTWTTSSGWTIASGGNSPAVTITAPATYGATGTATITVTDTNGLSTVDTVSLSTISGDPIVYGITVYYPPDEPDSWGILPTGTSFTAVVSAYSPKGLALNYTWTTSGGWVITSGANSSVVTVTAPNTYATLGVLMVTVSDTQGGLAQSQFSVQTVNPPPPPAIQSMTAWGLPVSPSGSVIANVVAQSSPGLTLSYNWTVSNGWTISTGGNTSVVTITAPGTYNSSGTATVTVMDSLGRSVSGSIPLSTISTAPVISNITAWGMPITPSTSFTATVSAYSPAGYTLYYTWTTSANWTITTGGSTPTVTITSPGAYSITGTATVIVYDAYGESVTATIPLVTAQKTLPMNTYPVGSNPEGIAIDASGNVWVVNNGSNNVTVLNSSGAALFTPSVGTSPVGIAIDSSGNAWVTNSGSGTVTELSSSGITIGTYPVYTAGASPQGIAIDKNGNIWIANSGSCSVTELNSSGYPIGTYSLLTTNYNYCQYASSIAIDASGNVWVNSNYQVVKLSSTGNLIGSYSFGSNVWWGISGVGGIAIDASGNVWVDYYTYNEVGVVTELSSTGNLIGSYSFGSNVSGVGGIAIDASGNIWVAGSFGGNAGVVELTPSGTVVGQYSTSGWSWWGYYPGIAIDATGNVWETIPSMNYVAEFVSATTGP